MADLLIGCWIKNKKSPRRVKAATDTPAAPSDGQDRNDARDAVLGHQAHPFTKDNNLKVSRLWNRIRLKPVYLENGSVRNRFNRVS